MARILYGVSGEGIGHATRSKEILSGLLARHPRWLLLIISNLVISAPYPLQCTADTGTGAIKECSALIGNEDFSCMILNKDGE